MPTGYLQSYKLEGFFALDKNGITQQSKKFNSNRSNAVCNSTLNFVQSILNSLHGNPKNSGAVQAG
jgi:hypothetical protein